MLGRRIDAVSFVEPTSWWFELNGGGTLRADTLWRIVAGGRVEATSADHGHRFGLPEPVDAATRATRALSGSTVRRASITEDTGDVMLQFDNEARLEILTTSSGYESWSIFLPTGEEIIGLGGGQVEVRRRDG
jgi:Family of unknown function (DUF6188)